jgi:hypothetical protein
VLDFRPYLRRPISTLLAIASDPFEEWLRFREQYYAHQEERTPVDLYRMHIDWEQRLYRRLNLSSPHETSSEFSSLWPDVMEDMKAKGIQPGPESFKGWNDGDAAFIRAIWALTRHLRPQTVVETGVAHGVTSRFILEALERNAKGHLWSIDRPPLEPEWQHQIGVAVDSRLTHRWSYIRGSSRRRLPKLISEVGKIDLFVHDSLHSERNVRFEIDRAWAALTPGGAIVVDDIDVNRGFHSFTHDHAGYLALVCESEPLRPDSRRFNKKGLFGIVLKEKVAENQS